MKPINHLQIVRYKDIIDGKLTVANSGASIRSILDGALGDGH
jgi:hypothetical protein